MATDRLHIDLDIRTRPLGRPLAIVVVGTLAVAIAGGFVTNSAFDARYASVVFIPLILLVSLGLITFRDRRVRVAVLAVAVVAGLASADRQRHHQPHPGRPGGRRPSPPGGRPGDVVAYCPDQLGPAVDRLLPARSVPADHLPPRDRARPSSTGSTTPRPPRPASPLAFADTARGRGGRRHQIFVVWAPGYQTLRDQVRGHRPDPAGRSPATGPPTWWWGSRETFYQPMWLVRFTPVAG